MARQAKKEQAEEKVELPDPEFDRAQWMVKEVKSGQRAILLTLLGATLGGISRVAVSATGAGGAGWLILAGGLMASPLVLRAAGEDLKEVGKGAWFGVVFQVFFSWLAAWYLLTNPPFA